MMETAIISFFLGAAAVLILILIFSQKDIQPKTAITSKEFNKSLPCPISVGKVEIHKLRCQIYSQLQTPHLSQEQIKRIKKQIRELESNGINLPSVEEFLDLKNKVITHDNINKIKCILDRAESYPCEYCTNKTEICSKEYCEGKLKKMNTRTISNEIIKAITGDLL